MFHFQVPQGPATVAAASQLISNEPGTSANSGSSAIDIKDVPQPSTKESAVLESSKPTASFSTPAQDKLQKEIVALNAELQALDCRKTLGDWTEEQKSLKQKLGKNLKEKTSKLRRKEKEQERQKNHRMARKRKFDELCAKDPNFRKELKMQPVKGRPTLDKSQPELLSAIIDIATHGCAADERRRTENLRSIKTLDELTEALTANGYKISRSGVYLRLLPRRSDTKEGQRHANTVPVRLARAQTDSHTAHTDGKFAMTTIAYMEELASVLGPQEVAFISQDDKARVPIGITAANKQAPLLMHLDYKVTLPDHDWVVAGGHKLIPSVYAGIVIKPGEIGCRGAVTYSGPTYIAVRSGKHSSSTALSHANDFNTLLNFSEFAGVMKTNTGHVKPVLMMTVDGGPDENPRYDKVICVAIHHFLENDLDALIIATNAPGRSAFNRVERRMAPLSRELAGLILPHEHYGSHLDADGRTIDEQLEKVNFGFAGRTLSEVWGGMSIDSYPVISNYIEPEKSEVKHDELRTVSFQWRAKHVRESQYCTQVVKCSDGGCCRPARSSIFKVLASRFLPPPFPLQQTSEGLKAPEPDSHESKFMSLFLALAFNNQDILPRSLAGYKSLPFDAYCPSVQSVLMRRICKECGLYHASLTSLKAHTRTCGIEQTVQRTRPVRLAARRQRELMAIIAYDNNMEDAEWIDEEFLDVVGKFFWYFCAAIHITQCL